MKLHAALGADILKSIEFPYPVEPIVRHHHENWNGTGYPEGLKEDQIPLGARILSVVDCYDALTSDRPYRPRYGRPQAEQILRERRGTMYDPWVVDGFLGILDTLERSDADEERALDQPHGAPRPSPAQLDVISATQAEEREFKELQRDVPRAATVAAAGDILLRHVRRVVPAACLALYVHRPDTNELEAAAVFGAGAAAIEGSRIPIGDRISGWALAHRQAVVNSDASLELGPVARTLAVPLRYALAVPIAGGAGGAFTGVVTAYATEPFEKDHCRMLETAATLFASALSVPLPSGAEAAPLTMAAARESVSAAGDAAPPKARVH